MKLDGRDLFLSPTDLTTFAACRHASHLDLDEVKGRNTEERLRDPNADVLAELGDRHERAYLEHLERRGLGVVRVGGPPDDPARRDAVLEAMRAGADAIAQAPLGRGRWRGVADVLLRVDAPSELGGHSYEVQDTKLSQTTKAGTVLQLSLYSAWLAGLQGKRPERFHVVAPGEPFHIETHRVDDYAAYTRRISARYQSFLEALEGDAAATRPEPVEHCMVCPWWRSCDRRWHADDSLVLVANLGRSHRRELERNRLDTVARLGSVAEPLPFRPEYGSRDSYLTAAHQARMQVASREQGRVAFELLPVEAGMGLVRLPEPTSSDVFLDLEGDPFVGTGGLEYLWGWQVGRGDAGPAAYRHAWALDPAEERRAFERFLDLVVDLHARDPAMHVYHYGGYEAGALKRLATRHGTREDALDGLLRAEVLVDLMAITRQAARIGVERYSLKDLERLHGYVREADLRSVGPHKRAVEHALMLHEIEDVAPGSFDVVLAYNRDDVRSTIALRQWLEQQRDALLASGRELPRPPIGQTTAGEELEGARSEALAVTEALQATLPEDPSTWTARDRSVALLAGMIDFERREDKIGWWEYFHNAAATPEELERSRSGVVGLQDARWAGGTERGPVLRYRLPPQDVDIRGGEDFCVTLDGEPTAVATVVDYDPAEGTLDLKMRRAHAARRLTHGFLHNRVPPSGAPAARLELARDILLRGVGGGEHRAAKDLLLALAGRDATGATDARRLPGEDTVTAARRLTNRLAGGVLPVQGPPGSGKSYTAQHVIVDLVRRGKRVGVTAVSNKVIASLLQKTAAEARAQGVRARIVEKISRDHAAPEGVEGVTETGTVEALAARGEIDVLGGTAWLWTRPAMRGWAGVLVVDEAGQISLATAVSCAMAAGNVVLLGDPQQLEQPVQASHPGGADVTALKHMIGEHETLIDGTGLFLDRTYRMAPPVCAFISEMYYEDRLEAIPANAGIRLHGTDGLDGAGLSFVGVQHEGCDGRSAEEAEAVAELVRRLVRSGAAFVGNDGKTRDLTLDDVLVVAPFNRQVAEIRRHVPGEVRVGTVDRFQGQEAPVVIYSMGVSTGDLALRGLGFLFSGNRFNVAISRAQARAILVAAPALFDAECRTPTEIRLVNGHIRFLELAR